MIIFVQNPNNLEGHSSKSFIAKRILKNAPIQNSRHCGANGKLRDIDNRVYMMTSIALRFEFQNNVGAGIHFKSSHAAVPSFETISGQHRYHLKSFEM